MSRVGIDVPEDSVRSFKLTATAAYSRVYPKTPTQTVISGVYRKIV